MKSFEKTKKNYCNRLSKRKRRNYYSQLNLNNITDNKKFWNTMKPFFTDKGGCKDNIILVEGDKGGGKDNIILVEGDKIISDDIAVAQNFNDFFTNTVNTLNINENKFLLKETEMFDLWC